MKDMQKVVVAVLVVASLVLASPVSAQYRSPSATAQERIDNAKERVCQTRQAAIENRMTALIRLSSNMMEKFDSISTRVQNFYTNKVLPKGNSAPNYDTAVADVEAKKALVTDALTKAQESATAFTCDTDTPRTLYTQFRTDMLAVKKALQNYRTSIKNLILVVHRAAGTESPAATPTATP